MLTIAIVGLPNVGKSTLFNALTKNHVLAANYPFATIEPNVGVVAVPDERLGVLSKLYHDAPIVPASVTFVDIAGLVRGASEGQGLGNKFLANIRECDAICQVVRVFANGNVTHVEGKVDPKDDIETINTELILADLQTLDNRLSKLEAEAKRDPKLADMLAATRQAKKLLDGGKVLFPVIASAARQSSPKDRHDSSPNLAMTPEQAELIADLNLLTTKPFIYVFNLDEADLANETRRAELQALVAPAQALFLCAKVEDELQELPETEALELLQGLGQNRSGLEQLITTGYATLGLQTFLTAGDKEVRAWTIHQGDTAPQAAGVIHTDFQKGFIRAEIVNYHDLVAAGSMAAAKAAGKVRLEGKDYVMRDGDVVEFRFNV